MKENKIIIDATNAVLGRLASYSAKQALLGKEVIIVNCKEAILTGRREMILKDYREAREKGSHSQKGPFFPKTPERILKRTIRGMLSYKQGRGESAFKRIICYNETPQEYLESKKIKAGKEKHVKTLKLSEVSKLL